MTEYDQLKAKLADRDWRISNLYYVSDKDGNKSKFARWDAQRDYWRNQWYLNLVVKARQLGISTEIEIEMLDTCLFNSNTRCGIIDRTVSDAQKKLDIVKFAYNNLPEPLKEVIPLTKGNTEVMEWANGSSIGVGTSHRGGTLQILHVSEFGPIARESPDKSREIIKGAFNTIAIGQMIHVESTPAGTEGDFYDLVQSAQRLQQQGKKPSELEFKLHFFPWHQERQYRLNPNSVVIPANLIDYFRELAGAGIKLDGAQQAFYAAKWNLLGPDDIFEEFPSTLEECFKSSIEGAYFKREMMKMREDKRLGQMPYDPSREVNTFWDIGHSDPNFIIFHQTDGVRHRLIDCYENDGEGLAHCISVLKDRKEKFGYSYGKHYGPHDLGHVEWASDENKSRKEIAASKGIEFEVVPRVHEKGDAIEAARRMLNMTWIDESKCDRLVKCLDNYRKEWNEQKGTWRNEPRHDWACLHPQTKILTKLGHLNISDLPETGEVLTPCGWKPYVSPHITRRNAPLVEVEFIDGLTVKCTEEHLFLTTDDEWRCARDLQRGSLIRSSLIQSCNTSTVASIACGRQTDTFHGAASACILRYGNLYLGLSRQIATSIIEMMIRAITGSQTWNVFQNQSIASLATLDASISAGGISRASIRRPGIAPQNGIDHPLASCGIREMPSDLMPGRNGNTKTVIALFAEQCSIAWCAIRHILANIARMPVGIEHMTSEGMMRERPKRQIAPSAEKGSTAPQLSHRGSSSIALRSVEGGLTIKNVRKLEERADVWCLTVPSAGCFSLANGAVVHNSHGADSLMTGAMGFEPELQSQRRRDRSRDRSGGSTPWAA